ncbi:MAG: thioredoxin family protein [Methanofollis liminatans]|uniref:Glutaredoxin 2 n=1 Tax=Methanofollis liminatans DSM 4140 TaxID=28892 RepID=J1L3R3_9EURY|nr:thioredoxin family protein [Methanofollis liminatans]EJG07737.1 glutaredoxin 2 [Methanofollis liminatans DSM 4140]MDD3110683.1 thioredoxin family protein [Methanofollis liminatans]
MPVRILCYYQEGCMGCMEQEPINRQVENELGVTIEEKDALEHPDDIAAYGLKVTPTILVIVDGAVRERFEGVMHRETLENAIKKYL